MSKVNSNSTNEHQNLDTSYLLALNEFQQLHKKFVSIPIRSEMTSNGIKTFFHFVFLWLRKLRLGLHTVESFSIHKLFGIFDQLHYKDPLLIMQLVRLVEITSLSSCMLQTNRFTA